MIPIFVNNQVFLVKATLNLIEACKFTGIVLPRFCYHEKLSIAANCRMCLVEIGGMAKPITACSHFIVSNLNVFTNTPFIKKARENILEVLLLNHPLDCPICDQGGECDLQDQVKNFGSFYSRFYLSNKRKVKNKNCSPLIKTIMTRCIHCTRCVRFSSEIAGVDLLGTLSRGGSTEIGAYLPKLLDSEVSGNVIDLCPVGALTAHNYHFNLRPWELETIKSVDTLDNLGANVYFQVKKSKLIRVLPKVNNDLNENWISDRIRFSTDSLNSSNRIKSSSIFSKNTKDILRKESLKAIAICQALQLILNFDSVGATFIVKEDSDLELLFLLQNFSKLNNNIKVYSIEYNKRSNFNVSWNFDKIKLFQSDTKNCFLFTSNIRVENVLLHLKLYVKHLNKNFKILQFGFPNTSRFPVSIFNLSFRNITKVFEAKDFFSSNNILSKNILFVFGSCFTKSCSLSLSNLFAYLRNYFPTSLFFKADGGSNSASLRLLGVKSYTLRKGSKSSVFFFNHLENLNIRGKSVFSRYFDTQIGSPLAQYLWFHSHKELYDYHKTSVSIPFPTKLIEKNSSSSFLNRDFVFYTQPDLTPLESAGIHLNLEDRPQKTGALKSLNSSYLNLKIMLNNFFLSQKQFLIQSNELNSDGLEKTLSIKKFEFVPEVQIIVAILNSSNLFDTIHKKFTFLFFSKKAFFNSYGRCTKYPIKFQNENFYTQTNYLFNSIHMRSYQKKISKTYKNF